MTPHPITSRVGQRPNLSRNDRSEPQGVEPNPPRDVQASPGRVQGVPPRTGWPRATARVPGMGSGTSDSPQNAAQHGHELPPPGRKAGGHRTGDVRLIRSACPSWADPAPACAGLQGGAHDGGHLSKQHRRGPCSTRSRRGLRLRLRARRIGAARTPGRSRRSVRRGRPAAIRGRRLVVVLAGRGFGAPWRRPRTVACALRRPGGGPADRSGRALGAGAPRRDAPRGSARPRAAGAGAPGRAPGRSLARRAVAPGGPFRRHGQRDRRAGAGGLALPSPVAGRGPDRVGVRPLARHRDAGARLFFVHPLVVAHPLPVVSGPAGGPERRSVPTRIPCRTQGVCP
jgi:hypothetical protein